MKTKTILFAALINLFLISISFGEEKADLILYNGKIITVDPQDNIVQAIAINGDKIIALGNDSDILSLAGSTCRLIDLKGKTVTPGLIDSHYHMMYYGAQFWPGYLNIRYPDVTCKADLIKVLGEYVKQLNPGEWISGNQGFTLKEDETLDKNDLDVVVPNNPVYLRHSSGQFSVVNSTALNIAHIDSSTPNPPGSLIMHDEHGFPNGILSHYPAENLVGRYAKGYGDRSDEQKFEDIEIGQSLCFQEGYTSVQDVIISNFRDVQLYKDFADNSRLKIRVYAMVFIDTEKEADSLVKMEKNFDSGRFKFAGWKLAMDGGIAGRTTLLYNKTLRAAEISYPYHTQDELNRIIKILHDSGYQVAVHVGGDEGIDMTLTAFEKAMNENPRPNPRHRIEHGLFPTTEALQRMNNDSIILSTQPQWINWYSDGFKDYTDDATMNKFLPLKTMLNMGIHLAFGCDVPASPYPDPKYAFAGAVLRRTALGTLFTQNECLTRQEALRIHTMGSAYAGRAETTTGSLETGKYADLVIWSADLYTLTQSQFNSLEAEMTIVGGEIVYDNGKNVVLTSLKNEINNKILNFQLMQNYPNPFNPLTIIKYSIPKTSFVSLIIYNAIGQFVKSLVNETKLPGNYSVTFNGSKLPSGIYYYKITAGKYKEVKKFIYLK